MRGRQIICLCSEADVSSGLEHCCPAIYLVTMHFLPSSVQSACPRHLGFLEAACSRGPGQSSQDLFLKRPLFTLALEKERANEDDQKILHSSPCENGLISKLVALAKDCSRSSMEALWEV